MMSRLSLALAGLVVLAAAPARAQPKSAATDDMAAFEKDLDALFVPGGLTADQAAARAAKVSPTVRRRAAELEAALASVQQVHLAEVPNISAQASYTRLSFIPPVNFGFGGMSFTIPFLQNAYDLQASIAVPLSDYVLRYPSATAAAQLGADSARSNEVQSEIDAGEDARLAYYEWVRSRLEVLVAQRQLAQVQATLGQVQALADVQRVSKAELMRIEAQEADAEQTLDQLQLVSRLREEQLRILIGAPDQPLAIGEDVRHEITAPPPGDLDALLQHATQRRLDVHAIDLGIAAKGKQRDAERANVFPHLSAFATLDDARPNQRQFPEQDQFKLTWLAGVQLTWQLAPALNYVADSRRIRAEADQLRADRQNLLDGTRLELLSAQQAVQLALHALKTTQKGLAAAEESYRVRKELLEAERATAVELVDAETTLTRARIAALDARVDLRIALTRLVHALGDDGPRRPAQP